MLLRIYNQVQNDNGLTSRAIEWNLTGLARLLKGKKMSTKIDWTDETWNVIVGCSKCSPGCDNCYAERMAVRLAGMGNGNYQNVLTPTDSGNTCRWNGKTAFVESALEKPLHWKTPQKIFVCSMSDLFHPSVPFEWIDKVFDKIEMCNGRRMGHTFQLLTKRPEIAAEYIKQRDFKTEKCCLQRRILSKHPLPNLWLGVTAENQEMWDKRTDILKQIPAALRFVSVEPMLGPIDATKDLLPGFKDIEGLYTDSPPPEPNLIDWVIIGAESGPKRRKCSENWIEDLMRQCNHADVPVFVKQIHDYNGKLIKSPAGWPREFPEISQKN